MPSASAPTPKAPPPTCEVCVACGDTDCLRNRLADAQATADRRGKLLGEAAYVLRLYDLSRAVTAAIRAELEGT